MQERTDRRIAGDRLLLWLLALLFAAAVAGTFIWLRLSATPAPETATQGQAAVRQQAGADEPLTITLYYPADGVLAAGTATVKRQPDAQTQAREALVSLFSDPRAAQVAIFKEVKLRGFFLDASGTAYADFSTIQQSGIKASVSEELLAIYAVVDTLTQNFGEIKRVCFLLEGKEAQTLAGHIDLSKKYEKRMDLVKQ